MAAKSTSNSLNALFNGDFQRENSDILVSAIEDYFCFESEDDRSDDSGEY